jgi:hypothetical protein
MMKNPVTLSLGEVGIFVVIFAPHVLAGTYRRLSIVNIKKEATFAIKCLQFCLTLRIEA